MPATMICFGRLNLAEPASVDECVAMSLAGFIMLVTEDMDV